MKIHNIMNLNVFKFSKNKNEEKKLNVSTPLKVTNSIFDKGFALSFGERLNRTPENFYAQSFNRENMPDTVKKYLFEDYEERHHMPPAQLQREAFEYLKIADSVDDVKSIYPDEPLFQQLKSHNDSRATSGILLLLRWDKQTSDTPIFKDKNEKELTLYILKKVYLEGKTLQEINEDFDNDATDEIKRELGVKDKQYFVNSTFKALGIKYPNLAYYNSFRATRTDKEYIPPSRKSSNVPRVISEETREKMSLATKKWWARLSEAERSEQIQKMLEGKEFSDSVYTKFQGPIMTLAAAKIGFSEKLTDIFSKRLSDEEFNEDFPAFNDKAREIMLEFWNRDSRFKRFYSSAINSVISDFEQAYNDKAHPERLERLLSQALEQKKLILEKARMKKTPLSKTTNVNVSTSNNSTIANTQDINIQNSNQQTNPNVANFQKLNTEPNTPIAQVRTPKEIHNSFKKFVKELFNVYPDAFANVLVDYMASNLDTETKDYAIRFYSEEEQKSPKYKELQQSMHDKFKKIHDQFDKNNQLMVRTVEFVFLDAIMKSRKAKIDDNLFSYNRYNFADYCNKHIEVKDYILKNKKEINKQMKNLCKPMATVDTENLAKDVLLNLIFVKDMITDQSIFDNDYSGFTRKVHNDFTYNSDFHNESIKFLKNFNALNIFINNTEDENLKKFALLSIIGRYLDFSLDYYKNKKEKVDVDQLRDTSSKTTPSKSKKNVIYIDSMESMRKNFKKFLLTQSEFISKSYAEKVANYVANDPRVTKEVITSMLFLDAKANPEDFNISKEQLDVATDYAVKVVTEVNMDFNKKYSLETQANEFAMKQTLYELTHNPDVFMYSTTDTSICFDKNFKSDATLIQKTINERYNSYCNKLSRHQILDFYNEKINPVLVNMLLKNISVGDLKASNCMNSINYLFNNSDTDRLVVFLQDYSGLIKYMQNENIDTAVKDKLTEKIITDLLYVFTTELMVKNMH